MAYITIREYGEDSFIEKKSEFIGYAKRVENEEEAKAFVAEIKSKHKQARHNCWGYVIGENMGIQRYSDDGEPQGTAGIPILEVMKKSNITAKRSFNKQEVNMKVVTTIKEVRENVKQWKKEGQTVGFVPTMGYLHEGHGSLITKARENNDKVVVSIFVNPMQFGPTEDLDSYPRDLEKDSKYCESLGVDLIFHPEPSEMYHDDFSSYVDMSVLTEELCGLSRPVHFRGVCTVVNKLFNIVQPDRAYFGEKDAQQLAIIKHMVQDLNMDIEVVGCPIIREEDGLAKSSRNTYLSPEERKAALVLSQTINLAKQLIADGEKDADVLVAKMKENIEKEPLAKIDYVKAVNGLTMQQQKEIKAPMLIAMAVYIGKTRLIDNTILH